MLILLSKIPKNTTRSDIINFLNPVLKGGFFARKGMIKSLEVMIYKDSNADISPYHGLVRIEPDSVAKRAISKLNRKPLKGKHITVREYHYRSWRNDPRITNKMLYTKFHEDRRLVERRLNKLEVVEEQIEKISITGVKDFHRRMDFDW